MPTKTGGAIGAPRDEIIDVERASGEQKFEDAITRDRPHFAVRFEEGETETFALLKLHAFDEAGAHRVMRPQFLHHGVGPSDLGCAASFRDRDRGGG